MQPIAWGKFILNGDVWTLESLSSGLFSKVDFDIIIEWLEFEFEEFWEFWVFTEFDLKEFDIGRSSNDWDKKSWTILNS